MPQTNRLVSDLFLSIRGANAPLSVMQNLQEVIVDQHAHLPAMFLLRLVDPDLKLIENGPLDLTSPVSIDASKEDGTRIRLIDGEITALEPVFDEGMVAELVVRGYDVSHRLYREMKSKAYLNKKDSDLAAEIALNARLKTSIDQTRVVYDHIFQHNQSDLAFLMQRAWRIGYECFVSGGTLYFRKPSSGHARVTLTWGDDLLSFRPCMNLAEQVDEVIVKGWDFGQKRAITGRAQNGTLNPAIGETKNGSHWAQAFGTGRMVIVDQQVNSQSEADLLASARMNEISGAFIAAEGVAFRRPDVQAGRIVHLEALGKRFSGSYLVTRARHIYTPEGLKTFLSVRGLRTGLFSEEMMGQTHLHRLPGGVTAIVTNTDDPQNWGRVKLKFPWMADESESDWARIASPGAGPSSGFLSLPQIGDEVLVVFQHGDFSQPVVLGGFWNGQDTLPSETARAPRGEKPLVRTWHSRAGHRITVWDNAEQKIEVVTAAGRSLTLSDKTSNITVQTSGVKIVLNDTQLTIESETDIGIKATANLGLEADGNIQITAGGNVNIKGTLINLNA